MIKNGSEILEKHLEQIKSDLIKKHQELGMKASGQWIESLAVNVVGLAGVIRGEHYTEQLVNGREPGKFPPLDAIRKWVLDKGIVESTAKDSEVSSVAFLVARKIAKEGTEYFKQGGTELVESIITPERIQKIIDEVSYFQINEFTSEITGFFKQLEAA